MELILDDPLPSEGYYALFEEANSDYNPGHTFILYGVWTNSEEYYDQVSGVNDGE